jgi:hypothetical protein
MAGGTALLSGTFPHQPGASGSVGSARARRSGRRGRRWSLVAVGGLVAIGCVLVFSFVSVHLDDRVAVLSVARPVPAGDTITSADLRTVKAADASRLGLVRVSDTDRVVGRQAAVPLVAGMLLTAGLVGDTAFPPAGEMAASVSVKPGQFPTALAAGAHVAVFLVSPSTTGATAPPSGTGELTRFAAVVTSVSQSGDGQGSTVVGLLVPDAYAAGLAAAPADGVVLMQTSPKEG